MMSRVQTAPAYSLASLVVEPDDYIYFKQVCNILDSFPNTGPPPIPTQLTKHLYIGSMKNADDVQLLSEIGITHVLNVAGTRKYNLTRSPYPMRSGIENFLMIPAEDYSEYHIVNHFHEAFSFLDRCKAMGGKALVHCNLGINRSGAICAGYLMTDQNMPLLEVITLLKKTRGVVLTNKGFRKQLIKYARTHNFLDVPKFIPQSDSIKFGTDRTNIIKIAQYPDFDIKQHNKSVSTEDLHLLMNGHDYGPKFNHVEAMDTNGRKAQDSLRNSKAYSSLPRNFNGNYKTAQKRPNAASHYNPEYFMDTIHEDSTSVKSARNKLRKETEIDLSQSARLLSKFGTKSKKDFIKSKSKSVACDRGVTNNVTEQDNSLSTTRPLRVYRRSVTDTEIYQKPDTARAYKRADTVATTDIASGLERLSLGDKASSMPSGLSPQRRTLSRLSLSSTFFSRFKSDFSKKS